VSPEGLLSADGTLDLSTGFEGTLDLRGWEVTLDGERGPVLEPATVSAASDPDWSALSNQGLNGNVYALAAMGDDLYVGGTFTQTVDGAVSDLGNIARYDTASDTWHALPKQGLNNAVRSLAAVGDDLYVGGWFTQTGDGTLKNLGYIARYDTTGGTWHALTRQGLSWYVHALAVVGDDLYVGGYFTQSGDGTLLNLGYIVCYDTTGSGTWHALPNEGLNSNVWTLTAVGSDLYVGGAFMVTGDGSETGLSRIARYDIANSTWHALPNQGLNGYVYALAAVGSDLYVGGGFTASGDTTVTDLHRIARYDTTGGGTWHALPREGLNDWVFALAAVGDDLYVGGTFTQTGDGMLENLGRIARYDTAVLTWNGLPNQGLDNAVYALVAADDDLYVGGAFAATGDGTLTDLNRIARYDATATWRALNNEGLNGVVLALAAAGSDLYVGGTFTQTVDGAVSDLGRIARYDTTDGTWHALPKNGLDDTVHALAVMGDDLYVAGDFTATGDGTLTNLGRITRYDATGGAWHALSNQGLNSQVSALAAVGSDLYVVGGFTATGDGTLTNLGSIARYDTTGGTWHALPNQGLNGYVFALAAVGGDLYVGGTFTQSGDGAVSDLGRIVRYDITGGTWHTLPKQGLNDFVGALAVVGDDLYAGGGFAATGDGTVTNLGYIARYNTTGGTWHALPNQGLDYIVWALAVVDDDLYVGGRFMATGDGTVTDLGYIARYNTAGDTWHALPNDGLDDYVEALVAVGDDLYVGGFFAQAGDGTVTGLNRIAHYSLNRHWVYLPLVIRQ
jgi:N-acetylneuraminic acid mutarotase